MIPYSKPDITEEDIDAVIKVLKGDWLTTGPVVTEFENEIAKLLNCKHAIAVCNGTAALHLCCQALGLNEKSLGFTSSITFLASANCLEYVGAKVDFLDVNEKTLTISIDDLENKIKNSYIPDVVIPVHFAGIPCDMERLYNICKLHDIKIIEDSCHAFGSKYKFKGKRYFCGSSNHSDLSIFSFHAVKTVTAGEGGMITTNNDKHAKLIRELLNHGIVREAKNFVEWSVCNATGKILNKNEICDVCNTNGCVYENKVPWLYQQINLGHNFRITDIQSALGLSQIKRINQILKRREEIFLKYKIAFEKLKHVSLLCGKSEDYCAYHLAILRLQKINIDRKKIVKILRDNHIFAQIHYIPVYLQPYYSKKYDYSVGKAPKAERAYSEIFSIPLYPSMTNEQVDFVIQTIKDIISNA